MLIAAEVTVKAMALLVHSVPIGTNMGLVRILWVMVNGSFLRSRGAIVAALHMNGFEAQEKRRRWEVNELLDSWQMYVPSQNQWRERCNEQYHVLSVDITGFWRPHLQGWLGRHYHNLAQKALPAVVVGVMRISGQVGAHRFPLLKRLVRCQATKGKAEFRSQLLKAAATYAIDDTVIVMDAEFGLREIQTSGVFHYVVRLVSNITPRRKQKPLYNGKGRPAKYGKKVRPLARHWKVRQIAATTPDQQSHFDYQGRCIQVSFWPELVSSDTPAAEEVRNPQCGFSIYEYEDPLYKQRLVLATKLRLAPPPAYWIYRAVGLAQGAPDKHLWLPNR